ncbi:LamG-like jellyroll fold domain-containing protein [Planctomycetota bacterium]
MKLMLVMTMATIVFGGGRAKADFTFGEPVNLGPTVNKSSGDALSCFSSDGLEMYLDSDRSGGQGDWDIWVAKRETIDDDWSAPVNLGPLVNGGSNDWTAYVTPDGLELYFCSERSGGYGSLDMWVARRVTTDDAWGRPENLGPLVNSSRMDGTPWLSFDGLELYFYSQNRPGGYGGIDIWISRRVTKNDPWGEAVNLGPVINSSAHETSPFLSSDGLVLFFGEEIINPFRPGGYGGTDMWMSRRVSVSAPWGEPVNLGPIVNSPSHDCGPRPSPDGSMLYFCSERPGGFGGMYGDIYQAPIIPIVDFNGDGIVDSADMCIIVDHWGTDNQLCDIGPTPLGDGIVDVEDLIVLAEHLFEEVSDPTLIAHWPLDETQGVIAYNSATDCDGTLMGDPVWLHDGGQVNGALHLDGVDDYVVTGPAPNPEGNSYSVLAWIKGGAPGQVVLSQMGTADWLCANPSAGTLMTELTMAGRGSSSLGSQAVITDGNWHRIGFVWDGSYRRLYVDGVIVAEDAQDGLEASAGGLCVGVGKYYTPGTFFSGLIDDIRIYNRAVSP